MRRQTEQQHTRNAVLAHSFDRLSEHIGRVVILSRQRLDLIADARALLDEDRPDQAVRRNARFAHHAAQRIRCPQSARTDGFVEHCLSPFQYGFAKREKRGFGRLLRGIWFHFISGGGLGGHAPDAERVKSPDVFASHGLREAVYGGRARKGRACKRSVRDSLSQSVRLAASADGIVKRHIGHGNAAFFQFFG